MNIRIETDSRLTEAISRESVQSFAVPQSQASLEYHEPAPVQMAGLFDTFFVYIDPVTFKAMLGAAAAIVGTEIVKDGYKWIKGLFQKNCEERGHDKATEMDGIEMFLVEDLPDFNDRKGRLKIRYHNRRHERGAKTLPFDAEMFQKEMNAFENSILPTIAHWRTRPGFRDFSVDGYIGPGHDDPSWQIMIATDDETFFYEIRQK